MTENRFVRVSHQGQNVWGHVDDSDTVHQVNGDIQDNWDLGQRIGNINDLKCQSLHFGKNIVGLAYNYRDLIAEQRWHEEPLLFYKGSFSAAGSRSPIYMPLIAEMTWVEVELAVVIGKPLYRAKHDEVRDAILGFTIANDITSKNLYGRDHHLMRSKSRFGYCPLGEILVTCMDTSNLSMFTRVNGKVTQRGNTKDRILGDIESVALASQFLRLDRGDVVITGTPAGALDSVISPGDYVELEVENVGTIRQHVLVEGQVL